MNLRLAVFPIVLFSLQTAQASAEEIDIYEYTSGYTYNADSLIPLLSTAKKNADSIEFPTATYDTGECAISTTNFVSSGPGVVAISIRLKRTYIGSIPAGQSLESRPLANLYFTGKDGEASIFSHRPLTFGILQNPMQETTISTVPAGRYVWATDKDFQMFTAIFEEVEPFTDGKISICTLFRSAGFEIKSIKVYLIQ